MPETTWLRRGRERANTTLIKAPLLLSSQSREDSPHLTSAMSLDNKSHNDEQTELLVTTANAGEGENQL